jgi:hypothetical protein
MEHVGHLANQQHQEYYECSQISGNIRQHDHKCCKRRPQSQEAQQLQKGDQGQDVVDDHPVDGIVVEIVVTGNQILSVAKTENKVHKVH